MKTNFFSTSIHNYRGTKAGVIFSLIAGFFIFTYSLITAIYENLPDLFLVSESLIAIFLIYEFVLTPPLIFGSILTSIVFNLFREKNRTKNLGAFLLNVAFAVIFLLITNIIITISIFGGIILINILAYLFVH